MKSKPFCLELQFRALFKEEDAKKLNKKSGYVELDRPEYSICLPIRFAWQEDANDLHIQLEIPGDREHLNLLPEVWDNGDYIVPFDSWLEKELGEDFMPAVIDNYEWKTGKTTPGVLVYCLNWCAESESTEAPTKYLKLLHSCWYSPNR